MTRRTKWLGLAITLLIVFSMGVVSFATQTRVTSVLAAGTKATHSKATTGSACKKKNKTTGVVKYSDWQFPDTLNPYQTTLSVSAETQNGMFDGLFTYNSKAQLVPVMATKIPSLKNGGITNGGKTVTVTLKKGLRWSNGAEITSKDIKFGWAVGMNKATGPSCSGSCDIISRIDTPSKYTAVLHLKKIYAPVLAYGMPPIWPTKWAGAWGNNDSNAAANKLGQDSTFNFEDTSYPTNGAYQVKEFVNNDRIVLTPMKYYATMQCGAYLSQAIFAFYSSKPALIAAAASKQTDVSQDYTPADLPELKKHTSAYKLYANAGFVFEHLELNLDKTYNGKPNPTANSKVRLALALALDKVGLIQSALGISAKQALTVIAWTPWVNAPGLVQPFANKSIKGQWDPFQRKYVIPGKGKALSDAKKLLDQTPYKGGFTIDFFTTSGNPVRAAQEAVVAASWAKIGVKVNPNFVPASKFFADWDHGGILDHGQFQVGMFAYSGQPDPDQFKYNMQSKFIDRDKTTHASINGNNAGINDKVINQAFDTAAHTFDNKVRSRNYAAIQSELNKQAYWITLYFRPQIATADSHVSNFSNNPTQFGPTWNMFQWKTKS